MSDRATTCSTIIRERLAEILEIDEARSREGQSFADDLGADSLALIELVEVLEEDIGERTVGFSFDDEDLAELQTVGDAVDYVHVGPRIERTSMPTRSLSSLARRADRSHLRRRAHLERAMVHRSYCAEHPDAVPNERLEFLGDAVLGLAVTDHVYATATATAEGQLAKLAGVVNARRSPSSPPRSGSARRSCSARARTAREGGRSRRSSPTRWRP